MGMHYVIYSKDISIYLQSTLGRILCERTKGQTATHTHIHTCGQFILTYPNPYLA